MKSSVIIFFLFLQFCSFGQIEIDTVFIKKNGSNIVYNTYKKIWFPKTHSYSFKPQTANHQDSLIFVIDTNTNYYFKVIDKEGSLILEGQKAPGDNHLYGDVKFYNKKGNLTRIEHWEPFYAKDSLSTSYYMSDGPTITSTKKFRKGKLVKEISYTLWIDETSVLNYKFKRVVITK